MKCIEDYEWIFCIIDSKVKQEKLFLMAGMTLLDIADAIGINRTYTSRAICSKYRGFRDYINTLRIEYFLDEMFGCKSGYRPHCDKDDFALKYGFRNLRSLDRILKIHTGYTLSRLVKKYFSQYE